MTWVTLGLGSNVEPARHIGSCLDALLLRFKELSLSSVFESEAVGFSGDSFLNMVAGLHSDLEIEALSAVLKEIEDKHGRDRSKPRFGARSLDIDILTYGDFAGAAGGLRLPRPEIIENAYILWPLAQVNGAALHPERKQSYSALWEQYDKSRQKLRPVNFQWHGRMISREG